MKKTNKALSVLAGLGVTATVAIVGVSNCLPNKISIPIARDNNGEVTEYVCMDTNNYNLVKSLLATEFDTVKVDPVTGNNYDFDINHIVLVESILSRELEVHGVLDLSGLSKDEYKAAMRTLLTKAIRKDLNLDTANTGKL